MDFKAEDLNNCIPTEADFKRIAKAYIDNLENGEDNCDTRNKIHSIEVFTFHSDAKLIRYLAVAIMLHWNKLIDVLKNAWLNRETLDALKYLINFVMQKVSVFENELEVYIQPINNGHIKTLNDFNSLILAASTSESSSDTDGFYMISAYDSYIDINGSKVKGVRRHIRVGKKKNGIYSVAVDSAALSSYDNLFVFDKLSEINNFIENIKKGLADTKRPVENYIYNINTKPFSGMAHTDLNTDFVKVQTTCGPAYICKYSKFCEE